MPRKKQRAVAETADQTQTTTTPSDSATATLDAPREPTPRTETTATEPNAVASNAPGDGTGKNYGPPYKAIFTSEAKGFEMGENRRYKQRVFTFKDRPGEDVIAALKDNGFAYRAAEKAWTTPATAESRVLSDRLAKQFAGADPSMGR